MRRKPGALLPIEAGILATAVSLATDGAPEFHGFQIAKELQKRELGRSLTAHGTLYKALDRLERAAWLESRWEDPLIAANEGRPRRRLYKVTFAGARELARIPDPIVRRAPHLKGGVAFP